MSKCYMSIHHQGYAGPPFVSRRRYETLHFNASGGVRSEATRMRAFYESSGAHHLEAPNVLPIGLICSARLP